MLPRFSYTEKQDLQKTIFPSGIYYDKEKNNYLTYEINEFVVLSNSISTDYEKNKNGINQNKFEKSRLVASPGIEPGSGASETLILSIVLRGLFIV